MPSSLQSNLEGFAQIELQLHERFDVFASAGSPGADEVGNAGVSTGIATGLDLDEQRPSGAPVLFVALGIGFEGKLELVSKGAQFAKALGPNVLGYFNFLWRLQPFLQGVA